jgi:integrase
MPLTDRAIKALKPGEKPRKVFDSGGLYLIVHPAGSLRWRFKYRIHGREKTLALGVYPDVTLAAARAGRDEARRMVAAGGDPSAEKQAAKARGGNSFEAVTREWLEKQTPTWAPAHAKKVKRRFERDLFPRLGSRPIGELVAPEILAVVRKVADRGAIETAHRALWGVGQVMRYAIANGHATADPTAGLSDALPAAKTTHFAAITDPEALGELLRAIEGYSGSPAVCAALKLAPMLVVRPKELRHMEWAELELDAKEGPRWAIPGEKMKSKQPHIVPLAPQAVQILSDLRKVTGRSQYVFPGGRSPRRPLSDVAVLAGLRRLGYDSGEVTGHGFRATFRTLADEVLGEPIHLIEHQLAHAVRDPLGRAYNRTTHLPERRKMMDRWAAYLESLRNSEAKVVPLRAVKR